jgi:MFS family permease
LLNFFMADMQAGVIPFMGVFLLAHGWQSGLIGSVMTFGGIAGMVMATPVGAFVDATHHKRAMVVVSGTCTVLASAIILVSNNFWLVTISQIATAIAGAAIGPAVTGITLGIVRQAGFNQQYGRNQAFNHAGNMVGAALSGFLGWRYGLPAVFWLASLFGILSILSVLLIPREAINDKAARGTKERGKGADQVSGLRVLVDCKPLLILAAALAFYALGNGAMLPMYGLAVVAAKHGEPASFVGLATVIAQGVMIPASLVAMRMAQNEGYWFVLLVSFLALPVRGLIAATVIDQWGVYPVQFLDGVGAGLQGVAVPGLVARILDGSGRINIGQGAVITVNGFGASLSPAIAGWIAQAIGYRPVFIVLGGCALVSIALWVFHASFLSVACASRQGGQSWEGTGNGSDTESQSQRFSQK